nr:tripartite tricarboxylate transporter substrate binding protein [Bordetella genomosp. 11]
MATVAIAPKIAFADDKWPSKPIRIIVPFAPGGANDLLGRAAAEGIAKNLNANVVVENKPGAGAVIGTDYVARADNDGYTFLISAAGVISNSMIRKVQYKDSDLVPVAMVGLAPSVVVAPASSPYSSLKDFVEASKKDHGLHFATAGTGSTPHFVEGILTTTYGAKLDLIPYKSGSESVSAVVGNQVDATSEASIVVLPMIRAGKLKALACTWSERIKAYPELSTAAEQGFPEIKIAHWAGVHAPKGTPDAILDKVAGAVDAAMKDPANVKRLTDLGIEPVGGTRADFIKFCDEERARLGAVVKATGMRQD